MAYASKELKAKVQPLIKTLAKEYGVSATLSIRHLSTLVLTVQKGKIDFFADFASGNDRQYAEVNYSIGDFKEGKAKEFLTKAKAILHAGNHNNSDLMTDYFDVGWYVDIKLGCWDKPYQLI